MTTAVLLVDLPGEDDPIKIDVDVQDGMDDVLIRITPTEVKVHSATEPKVVTT